MEFQNIPDNEIGLYTVMLSAAKGLSRWGEGCFVALSMTVFSCHPEPQRRVSLVGRGDASLRSA